MNKKIVRVIFFLSLLVDWLARAQVILQEDSTDHEVFGRSFMWPRPGYQHISTYNQLWDEVIYTKCGKVRGAFQLIPFIQKSSPLQKNTRYFLINGLDQLLVSGDANIRDTYTRDVRAEWLGLPEDFRGNMTMRPEQFQAGFIFAYDQDLGAWFDIPFVKDWQLTVEIPFQLVENTLNLTQFDVINQGNGTTTQRNILTAFDQSQWHYSKIQGKQRALGIAEFRFLLQSTYMVGDHFLIEYHGILSLPAAPTQNAKFIFDPFLGNNQHAGIGGGAHFQFPLNRNTDTYAFCFFAALDSLFLIRNKQYRTFDLKSTLTANIEGTLGTNPWSRFLLFNKKNGPPNQNIPGVNILTLKALIRPYGIFDFTTGWRIEADCFSCEVGFNIWGHDHEKIQKIKEPFPPIYGIAAVQPDTDIQAKSASNSTISTLAEPDEEFTTIDVTDIDLESAEGGSAINFKAHLAFGFKNLDPKGAGFFGFGMFVDVPEKNAALKNWGGWAKVGATF